MKVLVIGGTRFIGAFTAKLLLSKGHEVVLFHRKKSNNNIIKGVSHIYGDFEKFDEKIAEIKKFNPDIVLDMIARTENHANKLVDLCNKINCKKVVVISSGDVYRAYENIIGIKKGNIQPVPIKEEDELRTICFPLKNFNMGKAADEYEKMLVEKAIIKNCANLTWSILRLSAVYGPYDYQMRMFEYIKPMADKRPYILIDEDLAEWVESKCYVENAAQAIVKAIENDNANGNIFNVGEDTSVSELKWIEKIAEIMNWKGKIIKVPSGRLLDHSEFNTAQNWVMDTSKIRKKLHYCESISFDEGLERTIEWELQSKYKEEALKKIDYGKEDNILKELGIALN